MSAERATSRIQPLGLVTPEYRPGEPDLDGPPGAEPLIANGGQRIGWAALEGGRGAVGLDYGIRFDLDLNERRARYAVASEVEDALIVDSWERCVLPFALASAGDPVLHAAAVTDGLSAVAIAGASGTGKSTLRAELERFGYRPQADDVVAIATEADGARPRVAFLPFRPKAGPEGFAGPRIEEPVGGNREPPLRAIVVIARGGGPTLRRLEGAAAFELLLGHSYSLPFAGGHAPPATEKLLGVAARIPVFELRFPPTGRVEPSTAGALLSVLRGCGLWGGRRILREDRRAAAAAVPMAARYVALRRLGRLSPPRMARLALAPSRPRLPIPAAAREGPLTRLRAASALFPPGSACVERSLTVARALADRGLAPELVVGWSSELGEGHAWVELDGMRIMDDALPDRNFTELWRCDHHARIRPRAA